MTQKPDPRESSQRQFCDEPVSFANLTAVEQQAFFLNARIHAEGFFTRKRPSLTPDVDIQDLCQHFLIKLFNGVKSSQCAIISPRRYFNTIAYCVLVDMQRTACRKIKTVGSVGGPVEPAACEDEPPFILECAEQQLLLHNSIGKLPPRLRALIELDLAGESNEVIGAQLGMSISTIRRWREQAIASLRRKMLNE